MQKNGHQQESPRGPTWCLVLRYYTTGILSFFVFFSLCLLNNKRILMPHIDYTFFYVQTKGKLKKFVSPWTLWKQASDPRIYMAELKLPSVKISKSELLTRYGFSSRGTGSSVYAAGIGGGRSLFYPRLFGSRHAHTSFLGFSTPRDMIFFFLFFKSWETAGQLWSTITCVKIGLLGSFVWVRNNTGKRLRQSSWLAGRLCHFRWK